MPQPEVATQGLAAKPTLEADDMVLLHRAPDRDRRRQRFRRQRRRSAQPTECRVYGCDQTRELIDSDAVFRDITLDDTRDQARINFLGCAFLAHIPKPSV